jgi:F-type H+-transporting ATPase subunit delta
MGEGARQKDMKNNDTGRSALSMRYAKALYLVASEMGIVPAVADDLRGIKRIVSEIPEVMRYCLDSRASRIREMEFVESAFLPYVGEQVAETIRIMVRNGRLAAIPLLPDAFSAIAERETDTVLIILESAHELETETVETIIARMEQRTSKKVHLQGRIAKELLGGFRILWDNRLIDMSVAGRLRKLRSLVKSV